LILQWKKYSFPPGLVAGTTIALLKVKIEGVTTIRLKRGIPEVKE
jgi:hypothetical protein